MAAAARQSARRRYRLVDFHSLKHQRGNLEVVPCVAKAIFAIAAQVGAPEYVRTPQFARRQAKRRPARGNSETGKWEDGRKFKATVMATREGSDAALSRIRQHLNKLSEKTYDRLADKIQTEISEAFAAGNGDLLKLVELIVVTAATNGPYAQLYAKLVSRLVVETPDMISVLVSNFATFAQPFVCAETVDPAKNYDDFCDDAKKSRHRNSAATFYTHLACLGVLQLGSLLEFMHSSHRRLQALFAEQGMTRTVEELAELSCTVITASRQTIEHRPEWDAICAFVDRMVTANPADHASLTHRTVFKFMDLRDALQKKKLETMHLFGHGGQ